MSAHGASAPDHAVLFEVDASGEKDVGNREHDEDGVLVRTDLGLFAVADGAGGENAGNVASTIALASLARHFEVTQRDHRAGAFDRLGLPLGARRLSTGIHRANREVLEIARASDRYRGMGTTVVAIATDLVAGIVHVAHVGDSRCYRLRAGRLELLTQDHSLAQDVLELSPDLDPATEAKLPHNVITRALGMADSVRVSVRSLDLEVGDRFVLCSDGLTDVVSDEDIAETILRTGDVRQHAAALIAAAKHAQAQDNVAVVVVECDAAPGIAALPKRHATRPRPKRLSDVPAEAIPGDSWHDAEIVMVENEPPPDAERAVHVVPARAGRGRLGALQDLVFPRARASRPPDPGLPSIQDLPGGSRSAPASPAEPEVETTIVVDADDE